MSNDPAVRVNTLRANLAFSDVEHLDIRVAKLLVNPSENLEWMSWYGAPADGLWGAEITPDADVPLGYVIVEGDQALKSVGRLSSSPSSRRMAVLSFRHGMERAEICDEPNLGVRWMTDALGFLFPDDKREYVAVMAEAFENNDFRTRLKECVEERFRDGLSALSGHGEIIVRAANHAMAMRTVRRWWLPTSVNSLINDSPQNHAYQPTSLVMPGETK